MNDLCAKPRTESHERARLSVPEELRPLFDRFVADYQFQAFARYGRPYVHYFILAELVKIGWRDSAAEVQLGREPSHDV